ncbi:MAG: cysteine hydrolase [Hyphomicrobiales bacterium]|nr:cysteine hydrolase [Hyphomicrobiales bacterium]
MANKSSRDLGPAAATIQAEREYTVSCRHGRTFSFSPQRTAFLAIDMQRDFLLNDDRTPGKMFRIVPRFRDLTALMRRLGCRIIHTRESYAADGSDMTPHKASMDYVGRDGPLGRYLVRGEYGYDFIDELQPEPDETVLDKPSFGAFCTTDLDDILRSAGITHLVLAGVTTQCCVHSTLREAVDRGYWCLTVADCCAAAKQESHEAALALIAAEDHIFGWICDLGDIERACA